MSTPETKNVYRLRAEAVDRAVKAWQEQDVPSEPAPGGGRYVPATLEDCLNDEGLILLPRSTGHGKWRVEVDGQIAPLPGQDGPAGLLDAEEAADVFLTQTAADPYNGKEVVVRPATDLEQRVSFLGGIVGREQAEATGVVYAALTGQGDAGKIVLDRAMFEKRVNARFDAVIREMSHSSATYWPAQIAALRERMLNLDVDLGDEGDEDVARACAANGMLADAPVCEVGECNHPGTVERPDVGKTVCGCCAASINAILGAEKAEG